MAISPYSQYILELIVTMDSSNETLQFPFGHALGKPFSHMVGSFFLTIMVTAVISNLLLISAIISNKRLHSVLHVFIVNLSVCDLITSIGSMPLDVEYMFRGYFPHGEIACGVMSTVFLISLPSSVLYYYNNPLDRPITSNRSIEFSFLLFSLNLAVHKKHPELLLRARA